MKSFHIDSRDTETVVAELSASASSNPKAIIVFLSHHHDGAAITHGLKRAFPGAEIVGCTHAGAFSEIGSSTAGVSAMVFDGSDVRRAAAAIADFSDGVRAGVNGALQNISRAFELDLRTADPSRYAGIVLIEGLRMKEEETNEALGDSAPALAFVGGSAGDEGEFRETRVYHNGQTSNDGAVLLLLDSARPFVVAKTCSFRSTGKRMRVTRADAKHRVVYELDGKPALDVYANGAGVERSALGPQVFMQHPVGLMIEGQPWIRSPQRAMPDGGLRFYCKIDEGMEIELMQSTDLLGDLRDTLQSVAQRLGGAPSSGLVFNCILRRLDLDAKNLHDDFRAAFAGVTTAGFHTYGESYLGHINQTLTALFWK